MRVAVTGLTGQVVSSLIERAPNNVEMLALGRPGFDLSSRDAVLASLRSVRCDAIVNAAAYTQVDKAESEPELAMRINGAGAGFVAETAAELRVPLLHLSTDYVFDGTLDRPYREDDPTGPTGAYGRSKLEGEAQIAARCANCVILRTAWVYSPFGANFVRTMLRLGETRDEVGVVADQIGNPTNALDILRRSSPSCGGSWTIQIRSCAAYSTSLARAKRHGRKWRRRFSRRPQRAAASRFGSNGLQRPTIRRRRAGPPIRASTTPSSKPITA